MSKSPGLQQILDHHLAAYRQQHPLDARRSQVCAHISQCRTPALGGVQLHCNRCDHESSLYYACRDRHCPQCQQQASRQWAEKQQQAVLPVTYHHLVFTLPDALNGWVRLHPEVIYRALFQAAWATLNAFGQDPRRLGGQLGMTAVLHTWGQTLVQHVHLHCLVPGGALSPEGTWKAARGNYLFPVRALSRHFRGGMVSRLRQCFEQGELPHIIDEGEPGRTLDRLMSRDWVVYSKPCITGGRLVEYLARYSHRTAISNGRILGMGDEGIRFRYKDYRDRERRKVMRLSPEEFIRRYLLHVLPKGLMRIRHYGLLANCCRERRLADVRTALAAQPPESAEPEEEAGAGMVGYPCSKCRSGCLYIVAELPPVRYEGG